MKEIYLGQFHGFAIRLHVPEDMAEKKDWALLFEQHLENEKQKAINQYLKSH